MTNPVLAEVTRGPKTESVHRGAIAVVDADGNEILEIGDISAPVFPRSAIKAIQALPLVESGAADQYGFGDRELSLACASHSGEPEHIELARDMLARAGTDESRLECGGHWSSRQAVLLAQSKIYQDTPPAICNNCSGKHTGFICTAVHNGIDPKNYISPDHPVQQTVKQAMQDITGVPHSEDLCGTDGCSIPTYAIPLSALANGFSKMATGRDLSPARARAANRLLNACMAEPFYTAGTGRFCTEIMTLGKGRVFAKTGAEGVYCAALPQRGIGIAIKCDDGATRASQAMLAATLCHLLADDDPLSQQIEALTSVALKNWNGLKTGKISSIIREIRE